jgi:hypothetical protein
MGYDIRACTKNGEELEIQHHYIRGHTFAINGTTSAHMTITYNYCAILEKVINEGIKSFHEKRVIETIDIINEAINKLSDDNEIDIWKPTEGNVKKALINLRELAFLIINSDENAIWEVS